MERKKASDYPQELLNIFDRYVHGEMNRRDFLEASQKYAVGGLTATAIWESLRPNYAFAQQVKTDDPAIKTESVTVPSPQGNGTIRGYYVRPAKASGKLPAVLVIHENRGPESVYRRCGAAPGCRQGYLALVPDGLTSLGGYPGDEEKAAAMFQKVDGAKMFEDFVASIRLAERPRPECTGKIGVVAFVLEEQIMGNVGYAVAVSGGGGSLLWRAAQRRGQGKIKAPASPHYGALDTRVTGGWPAFRGSS